MFLRDFGIALPQLHAELHGIEAAPVLGMTVIGLLTAGARVQFQVSPCEICGGQTTLGPVILRVLRSFFVNINAPMSCTACLFIKEQHRSIVLAVDSLTEEQTYLHGITTEKSTFCGNSFFFSGVPLRSRNKQG